MFKRIGARGAIFIEYALILAFLLITGTYFLSSNGVANSLSSIFNKTGALLDTESEFAKKYPNNTAAKFTDFAIQFNKVNKNSVDKDALRAVFSDMKNNTEIAFSALSAEQKEKLTKVGLNTADFPNAIFYKDDAGRWYACWTGEDLSKKKDGDAVKVITYSLSGAKGNTATRPFGNLTGFYVGTPTYSNGSFTNGQISYDTETSGSRTQMVSMSDPQYGYTYFADAAGAQARYDSLK